MASDPLLWHAPVIGPAILSGDSVGRTVWLLRHIDCDDSLPAETRSLRPTKRNPFDCREQRLGFTRSWSRQTSGNDRAFRILVNPATLDLSFDRPL